jgi:hypothetical protein
MATSAPAATATSAPAATATVQPTPTVAQAWADVQPELERVWDTDTPRTVAVLDGFLARFPDYPPAREKLYAALISSGVELARAGETEAANQRFEQAQTLLPERGEAAAARRAIEPTPTQAPPPRVPAQPAPPPVTQVRPQPAPPPPVVVVPVPTPTKQPFSPPRG